MTVREIILSTRKDIQTPCRYSAADDNPVYFAIAQYTVKLDGTYPAKPRAWNPELSAARNHHDNEGKSPKLGSLDAGLKDPQTPSLSVSGESNLSGFGGWGRRF